MLRRKQQRGSSDESDESGKEEEGINVSSASATLFF
jgi:hypothetical protein